MIFKTNSQMEREEMLKKVKLFRLSNDINQQKAADLINRNRKIAGKKRMVNQSYVSSVERGYCSPEKFEEYAKAIGFDLDSMI